MGHTVLSQRQVLDMLLRELQDYGRSLRPEERKLLEELLRDPLKHAGSISYASSIHAWAFLLLSIILEQQKRIAVLEHGMADRRIPAQELCHPVAQNPK